MQMPKLLQLMAELNFRQWRSQVLYFYSNITIFFQINSNHLFCSRLRLYIKVLTILT